MWLSVHSITSLMFPSIRLLAFTSGACSGLVLSSSLSELDVRWEEFAAGCFIGGEGKSIVMDADDGEVIVPLVEGMECGS